MWKPKLKHLALITLLAATGTGQVLAQAYPSKPVRVIIPFAPGGGTDVLARPLVQKLGELTAHDGRKFARRWRIEVPPLRAVG